MLPGGATEDAGIWHADHIDYQLDLLTLVRPRKQRKTSEELDHNAAEGPHVDLLGVGEHAQHNIGRSIESTLDIGVDDLVL